MSTTGPQVELSSSDGSKTSRAGFEQEDEAVAQIGPRIDIAGGTTEGDTKQFEDLEGSFTKALNIQEANLQVLPPEPGFPTAMPKQKDVAIVPGVQLPTVAVSKKKQEHREEDNQAEIDGTHSGSAFMILEVKNRTSSTSDTDATDSAVTSLPFPVQAEHSPSELQSLVAEGGAQSEVKPKSLRGSENFGHPQECMDGQGIPSGTAKYPQQVADTHQQGWGYDDIAKGQFLFDSKQREEEKIRKVKPGQFPSYDELSKERNLLIYDKANMKAGDVYQAQRGKQLGEGGHGEVYESSLQLFGQECAVKLTKYRRNELNIWSQLDHRNIIPLLGVMLTDVHFQSCYQFMPRMTGDLRTMMVNHDSLCHHLTQNPKEWGTIKDNALFVFEAILMGLVYLETLNIQHSDLKARNILILKKCKCFDILRCICPRQTKYEVAISDFDSAKQDALLRQANSIDVSKVNLSYTKPVRGTLEYRAPEQGKVVPQFQEFKRWLNDGKIAFDMEGSWCDMWSFGVMVVKVAMGSCNQQQYVTKANIVASHDTGGMIHAQNEAGVALARLRELLTIALKQRELIPFAEMASECLAEDFRERPTAEQVRRKYC